MTNRSGGIARVIVAETDFLRSRLLAESVDAAGGCSAVAHDGDEALRLMEDAAPDVLVLDLGLSRPSSIELLRAIRRTHGNLHVVGVTRGGHADLRAAAKHLGVRTFIRAPFDPAALGNTLRTLVA